MGGLDKLDPRGLDKLDPRGVDGVDLRGVDKLDPRVSTGSTRGSPPSTRMVGRP
jgi:hypothetical protein